MRPSNASGYMAQIWFSSALDQGGHATWLVCVWPLNLRNFASGRFCLLFGRCSGSRLVI